jgi:hypothetical protein
VNSTPLRVKTKRISGIWRREGVGGVAAPIGTGSDVPLVPLRPVATGSGSSVGVRFGAARNPVPAVDRMVPVTGTRGPRGEGRRKSPGSGGGTTTEPGASPAAAASAGVEIRGSD